MTLERHLINDVGQIGRRRRWRRESSRSNRRLKRRIEIDKVEEKRPAATCAVNPAFAPRCLPLASRKSRTFLSKLTPFDFCIGWFALNLDQIDRLEMSAVETLLQPYSSATPGRKYEAEAACSDFM